MDVVPKWDCGNFSPGEGVPLIDYAGIDQVEDGCGAGILYLRHGGFIVFIDGIP